MSLLVAGYLVTPSGKKSLVSVELLSFFPTLLEVHILLSLETIYYVGKE